MGIGMEMSSIDLVINCTVDNVIVVGRGDKLLIGGQRF